MVFSMIAEYLGYDAEMGMMLSKLLVAVGAINWGLVGVSGFMGADYNLVTATVGAASPMLENVLYALVGVAGLDIASGFLDDY